ncbi:MAG: YggS family pyridoxal phosphate-dependent enzyme [Candidatus Krumholzibacteria bacterium]|nr:YggS family pyridoxal phosphate-dependent enzyme [Candidatus Krumholzibacteria bacterium]
MRRVRERVAGALARAGRTDEVTVVAVTKTFGPEVVDAVVAAGIADIGENRVQEFLAKSTLVTHPCRWHLVGPLQRNKATKAIGRFHLLHAIDGVRVAEALDRLGGERDTHTRVLLEVNTSGEPSKHGVDPDHAPAAAAAIAALPRVALAGLMTMGPASVDPARTRRCFRLLCALRGRVNAENGLALAELSMGMSEDFEIAIEEGATIVRLGRIITGERPF